MRLFLITAAAAVLLWPALLNGYPLLYPDSVSYIGDGHAAWQALLHPHAAHLGWMRSGFYSLGILPLHADGVPWPIIVMQAVLTAWVLWLVVRSLGSRKPELGFALLIAFLSVCTSVAWFTSYLMPDIFGALLYLAMYLLLFAREGLSLREQRCLTLLAWWSCLTHISHWIVAAGLCLFLLLATLVFRRRAPWTARHLTRVCAIVIVAIVSQLTLNLWLYRTFAISPQQPPMLTARILADGPAHQYLQAHCAEQPWFLCSRLPSLTGDEDEFLWSGTGVLATTTPDEQQRMRREEMPLVFATLRTYPRKQLAASARNAWNQLLYFDLDNFDHSSWMASALPGVLPGSGPRYSRTQQVHSALPTELFSRITRWTVAASLLMVLLALYKPRRYVPQPLFGLSAVVLLALVLNAIVTGVLSGLDARYQARVIWLLPLLAALIVLRFVDKRPASTPSLSA